MGVSFQESKYPVIDPKPGFKRVVNNFSRTDYQKMGLCAVVSLPFGYFAGTSRLPQMRMPSMYMAGFTGAVGGFCLAYQASGCRLMGILANDDEVRKSRI
mmetsp:Transcript_2273/g.3650  ORF Transcript_2273/g.3650 Transcript_2273/m.3650 type:complete len:100 (-) Transcript_2273:58-357(-)